MKKTIIKILIVSNFFLFFTFQLLFSNIWELKTNGLLEENSISLSISSRNDTLFLLDYLDIFYSTDYGDNWYVYSSCLNKFNYSIAPFFLLTFDTSMVVFSLTNDVFRIDNSKQCYEIRFDPNQKLNYVLGSFTKNKKHAFVALSRIKQGIYRSSNGGYTWEKTGFAHTIKENTIGLAVNDSCVFLSEPTERKMWRSCDNGASWIEINFPDLFEFPTELVVDNNNIYAIVPDNKKILYLSSNNGDSWVCILPRDKEATASFFVKFDVKDDFIFIPNLYVISDFDKKIIIVTSGFSSDGGKHWYKANFPEFSSDITAQIPIVTQTFIYKDYIFIILQGAKFKKLYRAKKSDLINYASTIEDVPEPKLSVYPNPSREFITIPEEAVKIGSIYKIIDNFGRVITEGDLSNQHIDVSHLPAGLYNIVLISLNSTIVQKFIKN